MLSTEVYSASKEAAAGATPSSLAVAKVSAMGAAIGAMIMAMPLIGISAARWNTDWRFLFLGVILLVAVVSNRYIRLKAEALRR